METRYYYPKVKYNKNNVTHMYIIFENGDYVTLKNSEIINFNIQTYDRLVWNNGGVCAVAQSGYIKLKICNKYSFTNTSHSVADTQRFNKNRKKYIEERCLYESKIIKIMLFDSNYWQNILFCNIEPIMEDDYLIFNFLPFTHMGDYLSDKHYVELLPIQKDKIRKINLDFENCESFTIYDDEILELNLKLSENLVWSSDDF